ncbi:MAG: HDOD domain-containing protein, partial [Thermodesulfobacteriota bacterium]
MVPFVARQPIFDSRKKICAYELLFHSGTSSGFPDPETETAGSGRFHPSFFTVGIDRITGGHKAFVGFSEDQLIKNSPALFPLRNIIVELKEGVDPTADVIKACHFQVERGYTLAIGTSSFKEELLPLIEISRIVKVDFGLTPLAKSQALVNHFGSSRCKMFADNLKTHEEFHQAVDMGFDCFQGFFFSRPEILKNTDLTDPQLKMIRLINEINTEGIDSSTLVRLINRDVSIPFKLIKYLGCPCFKRIQPITSTRQAVSFLGNSGVRKLVSLVAVAKLGEHKPNELVRTAI